MNSAEIIPIRNDESFVSEVDRLLDERRNVLAELDRLGILDKPANDAQAALDAIDRAIETLDAAERSDAERWAQSGTGNPPEPRNAERAGLVHRRLELRSDLEAARNRAAAITPRRTVLNGELHRIAHLIFAEKLRGAVEEARRFDTEAHERAKAVSEPLAHVISLKMLLAGEMMNAAQARGDRAAERLIGEAIGVLNGFTMPELGAEQAALPGQMNAWREALQ